MKRCDLAKAPELPFCTHLPVPTNPTHEVVIGIEDASFDAAVELLPPSACPVVDRCPYLTLLTVVHSEYSVGECHSAHMRRLVWLSHKPQVFGRAWSLALLRGPARHFVLTCGSRLFT